MAASSTLEPLAVHAAEPEGSAQRATLSWQARDVRDVQQLDSPDAPRRQPSSLREDLLAQGIPAQEASRAAVRASLQVALEASFVRCGYIFVYAWAALMLGLAGLIIWSSVVYNDHYEDQCDQPLALMLRLFYFIVCLYGWKKYFLHSLCCYDAARDPVEPLRVRVAMRCLYTATVLWPVVAVIMESQIKTCSSDLQTVVETITAYYVVVAVVIVALPACTISVMLCLVRNGYVREQRDSAPENFIDELPTIGYEVALFNDESGCFPTKCPICLDPFDAQKAISRTPCGQRGHAFHRECLDGWLRFSRTCPLCRTDVTEGAA